MFGVHPILKRLCGAAGVGAMILFSATQAVAVSAPAPPVVDDVTAALATEQRAGLRAAEIILSGIEGRNALQVPVASATLVRSTGRAQALLLGHDVDDPSGGAATDASPHAAALALLARRGVSPTEEQVDELFALDDLPDPAASALRRYLESYLRFDAAARRTYDADTVTSLRTRAGGPRGRGESAVGVVAAEVLSARTALANNAVELATELKAFAGAKRAVIQMAPALCLDLAGGNTTYTEDCGVLIDAGGNDTYLNNAGGSNLQAGACPGFTPTGAAALIDAGGNDSYGADATDETTGAAVQPRSCGANGGGYNGAGFLFDAGGNDTYIAGEEGTNGAGSLGAGFLLDVRGNDTYTAAGLGTNGGGDLGGAGLLVDGDGNDAYLGGKTSVNGGGSRGSGFLVDIGGNDTYSAGDESANGGGFVGSGFLLDAGGGNDVYTAGNDATNGGGNFGTGFLLDSGGNDAYSAGGLATNGGSTGGAGLLIDREGNDSYVAGHDATNGGGFGAGLLFDAAGIDTYQDPLIPGGMAKDCTIIPKGTIGAQMDAPHSGC
ncbi:MAG TPA: hypothetical protein VM784_07640 [Actinomycetota bacterium]|jgi:hypothetical protein|nr:hypothetical protein [Actinomycetota bacterium]